MSTKKRKKRRRYKLVLPSNNPRVQRQRQQQARRPKKRRPKRKLRKEAVYVLIGIVALLCLIFIPKIKTNNALKKLGYKKDEIAMVKELKLTKVILKNEYYSPYLAASIKENKINQDYLEFYTVATPDKPLNADAFLLINRLKDKGYEEDQLLNLYKNLKFYEMTPLLIYDYQYDESRYIEDCHKHSDNSPTSFHLSRDYFTPYKLTAKVNDPNAVNKLVNKMFYLESSYVPPKLTTLSNLYAANDRSLDEVAAEGLKEWCNAGRDVGVTFFATSAYRDYASQEKVYSNYVLAYGNDKADHLAARPGFSEHQTGLAVDLAATNEDSIPEFKDTKAFAWASINAPNYGWLLRYPKDKEEITRFQYEPWHYRYVGKQLAQAVAKSNLTYDEFYCLYLKPFDSEENKPSQAILDATDYTKAKQSETSDSNSEDPKKDTKDELEIKQTANPTKEEIEAYQAKKKSKKK